MQQVARVMGFIVRGGGELVGTFKNKSCLGGSGCMLPQKFF